MKKNLTAALLCMLFISCAYTQTAKNITISITGIEYDDPAFARLRDQLKLNPKTKNVSQGYNAGTAKLSFNYSGTATALWDELSCERSSVEVVSDVDRSEKQILN